VRTAGLGKPCAAGLSGAKDDPRSAGARSRDPDLAAHGIVAAITVLQIRNAKKDDRKVYELSAHATYLRAAGVSDATGSIGPTRSSLAGERSSHSPPEHPGQATFRAQLPHRPWAPAVGGGPPFERPDSLRESTHQHHVADPAPEHPEKVGRSAERSRRPGGRPATTAPDNAPVPSGTEMRRSNKCQDAQSKSSTSAFWVDWTCPGVAAPPMA
jgi:hypothetical protein